MFQSRRTFFRCAILDTLYKTDNAQCSQLLLKYRNDSLESIVHGICCVLAYAVRLYAVTLYIVTLYAVTTYAVTSLVQTRFSPCGDNVLKVKIQKLSLFFTLHCVLLLWIFLIPLTCRSSMVWSSWQK